MDKTGAMVRDREILYKLVVQTVLLYMRASWVITESMMEMLEVFNHQISRRLTGKTDRSIWEEIWNDPRKKRI